MCIQSLKIKYQVLLHICIYRVQACSLEYLFRFKIMYRVGPRWGYMWKDAVA